MTTRVVGDAGYRPARPTVSSRSSSRTVPGRWKRSHQTRRTWCCWMSCCPARTASKCAGRSAPKSGVPIVMLTAKTDTVDVVLGLESGADDYVVKPFKAKGTDRTHPRTSASRLDDEARTHPLGGSEHRRRRALCAGDGQVIDLTRWSSTCSSVWPANRGKCSAEGPSAGRVGYRHPADAFGQRPRPTSALQDRARPGDPELVLTVRASATRHATNRTDVQGVDRRWRRSLAFRVVATTGGRNGPGGRESRVPCSSG